MSWLQSPSAVILEPKKIKPATTSTFPPSVCQELMGKSSSGGKRGGSGDRREGSELLVSLPPLVPLCRAIPKCQLVPLSCAAQHLVQTRFRDFFLIPHRPSCHPSVFGALDCLHLGHNLSPSQGKKGTWVPGFNTAGSLTPLLPEIPSTFTQGCMVFGPLGAQRSLSSISKSPQRHLRLRERGRERPGVTTYIYFCLCVAGG